MTSFTAFIILEGKRVTWHQESPRAECLLKHLAFALPSQHLKQALTLKVRMVSFKH